MNYLKNIKILIESLPKKDIVLAYSLLHKRDFTSLKELTDSCIIIVNRDRSREIENQRYTEVELLNLNKLKSEIDYYLAELGLPEECRLYLPEDAAENTTEDSFNIFIEDEEFI